MNNKDLNPNDEFNEMTKNLEDQELPDVAIEEPNDKKAGKLIYWSIGVVIVILALVYVLFIHK